MGFKTTSFATMLLLGSAAFAQEVPKADIFFGYSFLRANSDQSIPAFTANGGLFNAGFNFTNHIALEAEFGGYHNGNVNDKEFDTTSYSFLFGPRFSMGRSRRVDPYFHVLFGVNHATTSIAASSVLIPSPLPPNAPVPSSNGRYETDQTNFAMAAGGGLDIKLTRHVVLRPIQLDYYLTRFETPNILSPTGTTSNRNQNNLRYAAGIMFNLGGERPTPIPPAAIVNPPPAMRNCPGGTQVPAADECPKLTARLGITATPNSVCPGDTSRVTASGTLPEGATLSWTVNGEAISQAPALEFGGTGRQPGTYRVGLTVTAEGYNNASAETTITVPNWVAPTGSLTANPQEISVGQGSTLSANFSGGQCGGPLGPITYTASEGTVRGNQFDSTGVRFDPAGATEQRKTVSLTAKVNDRVGSASANGSVVVKQAAALSAQRLSDVVFQPGSDRVNNCGKRVLLEDLKNRFAADPNGRVVLVGHVAQSENATGLDLKRAMNGAAVISAGSGICSKVPASQVLVKGTGAADNGIDFQPNFCAASAGVSERPGQAVPESEAAKARRLEVWFVPAGGMLPPSGDGTRDAASLNVSSLGCPN